MSPVLPRWLWAADRLPLNGSIIAAFRMTPFIVTLGMLGIARGVAKMAGR